MMQPAPLPKNHGNRCGHDPQNPNLRAAKPISKGKGGLPRILSLAAERAKAWYAYPAKCPPLQHGRTRKIRSERREAIQIVLETVLQHLDLASLCLGTPTLANGFIDIDMATIVRDSGIGQRRCERALGMLIKAGFMKATQPRTQNEEGEYFGCRAIRVVQKCFFEWLKLGPMLVKERRRRSAKLRSDAQKANRPVSDFMRRLISKFRPKQQRPAPDKGQQERRIAWNRTWGEYVKQGLDIEEALRRTNAALGYPPGYSPGQEQRR